MRRDQQRRALILLAAFLALAVLVRHLSKRGRLDEATGAARTERPAAEAVADRPHSDDGIHRPAADAPPLDRGARSALVRLARRTLQGEAFDLPDDDDAPPATVLISLPRAEGSARVVRGSGPNPSAAVAAASLELARRATATEIADGRIKLDLLVAMGDLQPLGDRVPDFERSLQGLWLPDLDLMLLPEELEARRIVDSDGDFRFSRLADYLEEGGRGPAREISRQAVRSYRTVTFDSLAEGPSIDGVDGPPIRLFRGNNRSPDLSPDALLAAARQGGDYLRSHQNEDGSFVYVYDAKRHREEDDDNLLRRAGTCYSLVQLHRAVSADSAPGDMPSPSYLEVARRGLEALLRDYTRPIQLPGMGNDVEALVSPGDELKLGGSALLLLALMEYQEVSGDRRWLPRGQRLARFLAFQQEDNGHFISKISTSGKRFDFESGYYPGEAILALTRLYEADGNTAWLDVAGRGADWLINVRDAGKDTSELAHDHWLLMGLEALFRLRGETVYAAHGERIAQAIIAAQRRDGPVLDWVGSFYDPPRSTPTATRAEALVAWVALARQRRQDTRPAVEALLRMASFQRRCQFDEVSAMYLERPDLAIGGFRRSLTHYEIRIDYVQHNISALLGLRDILIESK